MHTCTKCEQQFPVTQFGGWPRNKWCRSCCAAYQKALRDKSPNYRGTGRNKAIAALSKDDKALHRLMVARRSDVLARIRKYCVPGTAPSAEELLEVWYRQRGKCALTATPMTLTTGPHAVSIDQKQSGQGYSLDNIQMTTWAANRAKGDLSLEDFVQMCRAVVRCNDYPERE